MWAAVLLASVIAALLAVGTIPTLASSPHPCLNGQVTWHRKFLARPRRPPLYCSGHGTNAARDPSHKSCSVPWGQNESKVGEIMGWSAGTGGYDYSDNPDVLAKPDVDLARAAGSSYQGTASE